MYFNYLYFNYFTTLVISNWAHMPSPSSQGLALPGMLVLGLGLGLALRAINGLGLIGHLAFLVLGQC